MVIHQMKYSIYNGSELGNFFRENQKDHPSMMNEIAKNVIEGGFRNVIFDLNQEQADFMKEFFHEEFPEVVAESNQFYCGCGKGEDGEYILDESCPCSTKKEHIHCLGCGGFTQVG